MDTNDLKIMICDDSILARKKLAENLSSIGFSNICEAKNGIEAIDLYKTEKPNLVFMDITMPEKSGIEALSEIKEFDKNAKIIMASSIISQKHLKSAIEAGAYDFLQKPLSKELIEKTLKKALIKGE